MLTGSPVARWVVSVLPARDEERVLYLRHQLKVQPVLRFVSRRPTPEHRILTGVFKTQHRSSVQRF